MSKRRTKSKNDKKKTRPINVGKQVLSKMRLAPRVDALERFRNEYIESAEHKVKFDASVLFSVNGIVRALLDKNVITMDELNKGREEAVHEYVKEQQEREAFEAKKKLLMESYEAIKAEHSDWTEDQCKEAALQAFKDKHAEPVEADKAAENPANSIVEQALAEHEPSLGECSSPAAETLRQEIKELHDAGDRATSTEDTPPDASV